MYCLDISTIHGPSYRLWLMWSFYIGQCQLTLCALLQAVLYMLIPLINLSQIPAVKAVQLLFVCHYSESLFYKHGKISIIYFTNVRTKNKNHYWIWELIRNPWTRVFDCNSYSGIYFSFLIPGCSYSDILIYL